MGWIIINIIHKNIIQSESGLDYVKIGSWHNGTLNINRLQFDGYDDLDDNDDDDDDEDNDDDDDQAGAVPPFLERARRCL